MDKIVVSLIICFILYSCTTDREEVTLSGYSYGTHLVSEDKFSLTIELTDNYTKYILIDDSSREYIAPSFKVPSSTDSIIYSEDVELELVGNKQFQIGDSTYEVLKYEDKEREMTLFFNKLYGPIILRGNHYHGHSTWDRPKRKERQLIDMIRNDSIDFGGI